LKAHSNFLLSQFDSLFNINRSQLQTGSVLDELIVKKTQILGFDIGYSMLVTTDIDRQALQNFA